MGSTWFRRLGVQDLNFIPEPQKYVKQWPKSTSKQPAMILHILEVQVLFSSGFGFGSSGFGITGFIVQCLTCSAPLGDPG